MRGPLFNMKFLNEKTKGSDGFNSTVVIRGEDMESEMPIEQGIFKWGPLLMVDAQTKYQSPAAWDFFFS